MHTITQGVHLQYLPSTKYKTNQLMIKFVSPYTVQAASAQALLSYFLEDGSRTISDKRTIEQRLAALYGAELRVTTQRVGNYLEFTLTSQAVRPSFVQEDPQVFLQQWLDLLGELLFNQQFVPATPAYQARLTREKTSLITRMKRHLDDKGNLAMRRLLEHVYQGNPDKYLGASGNQETVQSLTLEDLQQEYSNLLTHSAVYLIAHGEFDEGILHNYVQEHLTNARTLTIDYLHNAIERPTLDYQLVTETTEGIQGNLALAYSLSTEPTLKSRTTGQLANAIYGGLPVSSLFRNVREKASLAYSIRSSLDHRRQLMIVRAGIDPQQNNQVIEQVGVELQRLLEAPIDPTYFEEAKLALISHDIQARDRQSNEVLIAFYQMVQPDIDYSSKAYQDTLATITQADVQAVLRTATPVQGFLLAGKGETSWSI